MKHLVDFHDFPRVTPLYLDYLYDFDKVGTFYNSTLRPYELLSTPSPCAASTLQCYPQQRRSKVAAILERQNRHLGARDDVFAHIEKLKKENCCAIVTGQQVGLFGGPLFTFFKTLAAVRLAHALIAKGLNVVPIFWINDIDHDFEEVNHCRLLDQDRRIVEVTYHRSPQYEGMPVGHISLGSEIESTLEELERALPATEYLEKLMKCVRDSYRPGLSFSEGFSRTILELFRGYGLILMDPLDSEFQEMCAPLYERAIQESESLNESMCERNRELEAAGYHAQVHTEPHSTLLFLSENGRRNALQRFDHHYRLKGTGTEYSERELLTLASEEPARLTPNVALRPVVQDYLLPTTAYIGGPAEVAYFAQLAPLYQRFDRPMPLIFPRPSFTLIEKGIQEIADRYRMELVDFFGAENEVLDKAFNGRLPEPLAQALAGLQQDVPSELESLRPTLEKLDRTLADALDRAQQKIAHQVAALRTKLVHAEERGHEDLAREIRSCLTSLYPNQNLQEREVSILSFLARYGPELIHRLYEQTDLSSADHQIVALGS